MPSALVGAELDDIKKLKKDADYLVEWDIPAEITMEQYLTRKKANAPKYAEVPEVSFLRTYVREDTAKCLCFYDAPDRRRCRPRPQGRQHSHRPTVQAARIDTRSPLRRNHMSDFTLEPLYDYPQRERGSRPRRTNAEAVDRGERSPFETSSVRLPRTA